MDGDCSRGWEDASEDVHLPKICASEDAEHLNFNLMHEKREAGVFSLHHTRFYTLKFLSFKPNKAPI